MKNWLILAIALIIVAAGCTKSTPTSSPFPSPTPASTPTSTPTPERQGRILVVTGTADIFQVVSGERTQEKTKEPARFTGTKHFAVDGRGNTVIGSPDDPKEVILYDTADGTPYSLRITNGQLSITRVNDEAR